jgi:hypothetical protein
MENILREIERERDGSHDLMISCSPYLLLTYYCGSDFGVRGLDVNLEVKLPPCHAKHRAETLTTCLTLSSWEFLVVGQRETCSSGLLELLPEFGLSGH